MLPLHRGGTTPTTPTSAISASLSRLAKNPQPLSKFLLRWVILGCTVVAFLWFAGPFVLDFVRPSPMDYSYPSPIEVGLPEAGNGGHIGAGGKVGIGAGDGIGEGGDGIANPPPPVVLSPEDQKKWEDRKGKVRDAFSHAWKGYREHAYPADELTALTGGKSNKYNGWGVTLYDSLDTMWIMGLRNEFDAAVKDIATQNFTATKPGHYAPFFETTIRYLGGTLAAYGLSKNKVLLDHADELGRLLLPAFKNTPSGLPAYSVHVESGEVQADQGKRTVLFAEATTCQLEFKYLAKITGKKEYYQTVQKAMNIFYKANVTDGLFHDNWSWADGKPSGEHFTIGATADSGYEYLLKQWLLTGDVDARNQYIRSIEGMLKHLIRITPNRGLLYAGDLVHSQYVDRLEHLSCYLPGLLALGSHTLPGSSLTPRDRQMHRWAAEGLGYTCAVNYLESVSGLGVDEMTMPKGGNIWREEVIKWEAAGGGRGKPPGVREPKEEKETAKRDYWGNWPYAYLLRPETVESVYYLWKATHDPKWRERGWRIFEAIEKHTKTQWGYASIHGIDSESPIKLDDMPSWFLAETLKYLYLLFDDSNTIPLDKYVFNTEAHPLPVFEWTQAERKEFGVDELMLNI